MLQPMQQPATSQPSPSLSGFAGLLATLASSPTSLPSDAAADAPLWNSRDLGEDVATLSYEHALRAHARYRPLNRDSSRVDRSAMLPGELGNDTSAEAAIKNDAAVANVAADVAPGWTFGTSPDRELRSASVTIRLNKAECARLHRRAAEAGLTVSAYLRSCALEAEALRAQVKQALTELKAGNKGTREQGNERPKRRNFLGWIRWFTRRER